MALVSKAIPNIINGVSQQPATRRLPSQGELQENCYSSVVKGLGPRPGSFYSAKLLTGSLTDANVHVIERDASERYLVVMTNGDLKVFDMDGTEKTVNFPDGKAYLAATNPSTQMKALTVADYTFIVNTTKTVAMDSTKTANRGVEAVVWFDYLESGSNCAIYINGTKVADHAPSAAYIYPTINDFYNDLVANLGTTDWDFQKDGGSYPVAIWIKRKDGANFDISVENEDNKSIHLLKFEVQDFTDLPTIAPNGYKAKIVGHPTSAYDDYYVEFVCNNDQSNTFSKGYWKETVAMDIEYMLDPSTMPHVLIRNADGTFTFQKRDWDVRKCGDLDSNPNPSFVGATIDDVFFYRNRLGFLSQDNVILSEAGSFFNFFATTATTLVDSDPVDTAASHTKVCFLKHAVPFQESLILFSNLSQFILDSGDILSSSTAVVKPLTEFEADNSVSPVNSGKVLYFPVLKGNYTGIMEFYLDPETGLRDAVDITAHIPHYIPSGVEHLAVATNENIMAVNSPSQADTIFIYKYFWSGDEKLQSSWSKWTFTDSSILAFAFLDSYLHLITQYSDGVYLEKIPVMDSFTDENESIEFHLDRKLTEADCSVVYDSVSNLTTWTLPYQVTSNAVMKVVTRYGAVEEGVLIPVYEATGTTVKAVGDYSTTPVFIGVQYTSRYRFSTQYLTESNGESEIVVTSGRLQIRRMKLLYSNSGYFKVEVTPKHRSTYEYEFTGRVMGQADNIIGQIALSSGEFSFPVLSKNDAVTIDIVSDSFLPYHIMGADWTGFYTSHSQRM